MKIFGCLNNFLLPFLALHEPFDLLAACTSGAFFRLCFAQALWPQLQSLGVLSFLAGFWLEDVIGVCSMVNKCNKPFLFDQDTS